MRVVHSGYHLERIATYNLGELLLTKKGNKYILVVADYYTKWTESFAIPNMESTTIARVIVVKEICRIGTPAVILSDQGQLC